MSDLERRFAIRVQDLRCALDRRLSSRVDKLLRTLSGIAGALTHLQEHAAKDAIRLLVEDGAEDDGDAIRAGRDVDGLGRTAGSAAGWTARTHR